jgi:broad specificity phosphatase PhoE
LTLVSHGQTAAGRAGRFPADEPVGVEELRRAAAALATTATTRLRADSQALCDTTARTRQTAQALGLSAVPDPGLADLDVAAWTGRRLDEIAETDLRAWVTDPAAAPHGGESVLDLLNRVRQWLADRESVPRNVSGNIIAVTHPAVVRAVLVTALRSPPEIFWRIDVPPLTTTLLHRRGDWTLRHACRPLD